MKFQFHFSNKYPWYVIIELSCFDNIDLEKKIEFLLEEVIEKGNYN